MSARRLLLPAAVVPVLAAGLFLAGALSTRPPSEAPAPPAARAVEPALAGITAAQARLGRVPRDARTWAELALLYVAQAKTTGDSAWYAKAEGATQRSLRLDTRGNDAGYAAQAAVANARHDFQAALAAARRGLRINSYSATLLGAQADALVQLGRYDEARESVVRLNRLRPGVPAFTRASYDRELRGDVAGARVALERALLVATAPSDLAFARTQLGELALAYQGRYAGTAAVALEHFDAGLRVAPDDHALLDGRARTLTALGRTDEALDLYRELVERVPLPQYLLEYGELLQSFGRASEAQEQYGLLELGERLQRAAGLLPDVEATMFAADHGTPAAALRLAREGWRSRPFLEMADAYAWALYRNHRYAEALVFSDKALATGRPSALASFHRGMIEQALGHDTEAQTYLETALSLNPAFHPLHAPSARRELAELRG